MSAARPARLRRRADGTLYLDDGIKEVRVVGRAQYPPRPGETVKSEDGIVYIINDDGKAVRLV